MDRRDERNRSILGPFLVMLFAVVALNLWGYLTQP
jgi:hypothetical protein